MRRLLRILESLFIPICIVVLLILLSNHTKYVEEQPIDYMIDIPDDAELVDEEELIWKEINLVKEYNFKLEKKSTRHDKCIYEVVYLGNNIYDDLTSLSSILENDNINVIIMVQSSKNEHVIDYYYDDHITRFN